MYRILHRDEEFRSLNIPLPEKEEAVLAESLRKDAGVGRVYYWRDTILVGYELYEMHLRRHTVPPMEEKFFPRREDAVAWICRIQLSRKDLCNSAIAWLIYRLCEAESKIENRSLAREDFQYRRFTTAIHTEPQVSRVSGSAVRSRISREFHLCEATVSRYVTFGKGLDQLEILSPGIRLRVLTGEVEVSLLGINALLSSPRAELLKMLRDPSCKKLVPVKRSSRQLPAPVSRRSKESRIHTAIKEMPAYDPDAALNGLAFTVSAWVKAVSRVRQSADLPAATENGKTRLRLALAGLSSELEALEGLLGGSSDE